MPSLIQMQNPPKKNGQRMKVISEAEGEEEKKEGWERRRLP